MKSRLNLYMDKDIILELGEIAQHEDRTVSGLARYFVLKGIEEYNKRMMDDKCISKRLDDGGWIVRPVKERE